MISGYERVHLENNSEVASFSYDMGQGERTYAAHVMRRPGACSLVLCEDKDLCLESARFACAHALKEGGEEGALQSFLSTSKAIRAWGCDKEHAHDRASLVVATCADHVLTCAWVGDICGVHITRKGTEAFLKPIGVGYMPGQFDPLGSSPAWVRRRLEPGEAVVLATGDMARSTFVDRPLCGCVTQSKSVSATCLSLLRTAMRKGVPYGAWGIIEHV